MIQLPEDTRKVTPKDEFAMTRHQNVSPRNGCLSLGILDFRFGSVKFCLCEFGVLNYEFCW